LRVAQDARQPQRRSRLSERSGEAGTCPRLSSTPCGQQIVVVIIAIIMLWISSANLIVLRKHRIDDIEEYEYDTQQQQREKQASKIPHGDRGR
jgi:hypothetical protein